MDEDFLDEEQGASREVNTSRIYTSHGVEREYEDPRRKWPVARCIVGRSLTLLLGKWKTLLTGRMGFILILVFWTSKLQYLHLVSVQKYFYFISSFFFSFEETKLWEHGATSSRVQPSESWWSSWVTWISPGKAQGLFSMRDWSQAISRSTVLRTHIHRSSIDIWMIWYTDWYHIDYLMSHQTI